MRSPTTRTSSSTRPAARTARDSSRPRSAASATPACYERALRARDPHHHDRQRLPGRRRRAADPRPRVRRAQRARPPRPHDLRRGRSTSAGRPANTLDDRRAATPLARFDTSFGVFNPSRYANARRHDRPHAPAVLGDRRRRRPRQRRRLLAPAPSAARRSTTRGRRSTAPAATSTSRHEGRERRRPRAGGPTRTAATPRRRRSPAASASSSRPPRNQAGRDVQVFGRNRTHDAEGVHAPN